VAREKKEAAVSRDPSSLLPLLGPCRSGTPPFNLAPQCHPPTAARWTVGRCGSGRNVVAEPAFRETVGVRQPCQPKPKTSSKCDVHLELMYCGSTSCPGLRWLSGSLCESTTTASLKNSNKPSHTSQRAGKVHFWRTVGPCTLHGLLATSHATQLLLQVAT